MTGLVSELWILACILGWPLCLALWCTSGRRAAPGPDYEIPAGQWACQQCGSAWYGTPPEDWLCRDCHTGGGQ